MAAERGLTVAELLVAAAVFWLVMLVAVPGLRSLFLNLEFHAALRGVTVGLNAARSEALLSGQPVRVEVSGRRLRLSRDDGQGWREFRGFDLGRRLAVSANSRPVFSPLGGVAPLCTVTLRAHNRTDRVVVSMHGRIRVYRGR